MVDQQRRLTCLDGLRGVAAVVVVVYHMLSAVMPDIVVRQSLHSSWIAYSPVAVFWNGNLVVSVFFALSGFVLTKASLGKNDTWLVNVVIRYLRLAIPALASSLIAWLLLKAYPDAASRLQTVTGSLWLAWTFQNDIPGIPTAVYSGLVDIFLNGGSHFNNVLWTMRPELIGSMFCFAICTVRAPRLRLALILAFAILFIGLGRGQYSAFAAGALLHEAWRAEKLPSRFALAVGLAGLMLGSQIADISAGIGFSVLSAFGLNDAIGDLSGVLAASMIVYGSLSSRHLRRWLSSRTGQFLGFISFPLYLIHVPILYTVFASAWYDLAYSTANAIVLITIFAAGSMLASYLLARYAELPFLRLLGSLKGKLKAAFERRRRTAPVSART